MATFCPKCGGPMQKNALGTTYTCVLCNRKLKTNTSSPVRPSSRQAQQQRRAQSNQNFNASLQDFNQSMQDLKQARKDLAESRRAYRKAERKSRSMATRIVFSLWYAFLGGLLFHFIGGGVGIGALLGFLLGFFVL